MTKTARPALSYTVGALATLQLVTAIPALVMSAITLGNGLVPWGFGGSIGLVVVSLLGIYGGFGRRKWALACYGFLNLVAIAFSLITTSLLWQQNRLGAVLVGILAAVSALLFISVVFGFFGSMLAFAAAGARKTVNTTGPSWHVAEANRKRVIQMNRTVLALSILQMLTAIPALVMAAIDSNVAGWWTMGGSIGLVVTSIFGMVAAVRARRVMHALYALSTLTAIGFTLVGVGIYFNVSNVFGADSLTPLQKATAALGFIASTFGFFGSLVSLAVFRTYKRRVTAPVAAPVAVASTVAAPTVVTGEEAPGISPRAQPAVQLTTIEPQVNRFAGVPAPAAPLATRV